MKISKTYRGGIYLGECHKNDKESEMNRYQLDNVGLKIKRLKFDLDNYVFMIFD